MCATCGCSAGSKPAIVALGDGHDHHHDHGHDHDHDHGPETRTIRLEQEILAKNDRLAERNRGWLAARGVVAWNLMSSPGAGKTTLLERTIRDRGRERPFAVVEGDQATTRDAERIRATGCAVVQVNTGAGCHLDAGMVADALGKLDPPCGTTVMIENVGNLVCPALFDLGERGKVVILSVTEGEDKPLKYPHMFRAADLMILTKVDLLPYVPFDADRCIAWAAEVHPGLPSIRLSATTGEGLERWYSWLEGEAGR